jgi:hypothetical protein
VKRIVCLALAALPVLGQLPERPVADIALYYDFEHQPPDTVQEALELETTSILEPIGEAIEWRPLSKVRPGDVAVELAVLSFKGSCDLSQPLPKDIDRRRTLGFTHISDGAILPFSDIDCDRIRAFIGGELQHLQAKDREATFGRAVGRVVAHELYHIFANTTHHESSGVARSAFTVKELTADSFRLQEAAVLRPKRPGEAAVRDMPAPDGRSLFAGGGCVTCHGDRGEGTANGPAIRKSRRFNALSLGAKLGGHASQMYRRARDLHIPLRIFGQSEMRALVKFLNTLN